MRKIIYVSVLVIFAFSASAQIIKPGKGKKIEEAESFQKVEPQWEFKKHDMVQLNVFDMVFTNVSIAYEHFSKDGTQGFQLPLSFNAGGLPDTGVYYQNNSTRFIASKNRIFQTGLNYNYYFIGQEKVSPYMGIGVTCGWFNYWKYDKILQTSPYGGGSYYGYKTPGEKMIGSNYAGALFAGILFNPKETVTFNIKAGFGLRRYETTYTEYTVGYGVFEVCLGFKFN